MASAAPWDTFSILYLPKALQALSIWWKFAVITSSHFFELLQFVYFMDFQDPEVLTERGARKTLNPHFKSLAGPILTKISKLLYFEMLHTNKIFEFWLRPRLQRLLFQRDQTSDIKRR